MADSLEELNALAAKSGRSRKAAETGAALLVDEFCTKRNTAFAAEYLAKFHYSVCLYFVKNSGLTEEEAAQIALAWKFYGKSRFSCEFAFCRALLENGFSADTAAHFAVFVIHNGTSVNAVEKNGFLAAMLRDYRKVFHSVAMREKFAQLSKFDGCDVVAVFANEAQGGDVSLLEVSELRRRLVSAQAEIDDLNARLEQSFRMDAIKESTAVETLKNSVSEALKEEYDEYRRCDHSFNEDNFAANMASLLRIFKILKRYGFSFE